MAKRKPKKLPVFVSAEKIKLHRDNYKKLYEMTKNIEFLAKWKAMEVLLLEENEIHSPQPSANSEKQSFPARAINQNGNTAEDIHTQIKNVLEKNYASTMQVEKND